MARLIHGLFIFLGVGMLLFLAGTSINAVASPQGTGSNRCWNSRGDPGFREDATCGGSCKPIEECLRDKYDSQCFYCSPKCGLGGFLNDPRCRGACSGESLFGKSFGKCYKEKEIAQGSCYVCKTCENGDFTEDPSCQGSCAKGETCKARPHGFEYNAMTGQKIMCYSCLFDECPPGSFPVHLCERTCKPDEVCDMVGKAGSSGSEGSFHKCGTCRKVSCPQGFQGNPSVCFDHNCPEGECETVWAKQGLGGKESACFKCSARCPKGQFFKYFFCDGKCKETGRDCRPAGGSSQGESPGRACYQCNCKNYEGKFDSLEDCKRQCDGSCSEERLRYVQKSGCIECAKCPYGSTLHERCRGSCKGTCTPLKEQPECSRCVMSPDSMRGKCPEGKIDKPDCYGSCQLPLVCMEDFNNRGCYHCGESLIHGGDMFGGGSLVLPGSNLGGKDSIIKVVRPDSPSCPSGYLPNPSCNGKCAGSERCMQHRNIPSCFACQPRGESGKDSIVTVPRHRDISVHNEPAARVVLPKGKDTCIDVNRDGSPDQCKDSDGNGEIDPAVLRSFGWRVISKDVKQGQGGWIVKDKNSNLIDISITSAGKGTFALKNAATSPSSSQYSDSVSKQAPDQVRCPAGEYARLDCEGACKRDELCTEDSGLKGCFVCEKNPNPPPEGCPAGFVTISNCNKACRIDQTCNAHPSRLGCFGCKDNVEVTPGGDQCPPAFVASPTCYGRCRGYQVCVEDYMSPGCYYCERAQPVAPPPSAITPTPPSLISSTPSTPRSCEDLCKEKGLSPNRPNYRDYLESQLSGVTCVSGITVRSSPTLRIGECTCYNQGNPEISIDSTPPTCNTDCGPVPCGQERSCSCGQGCTRIARCFWKGWFFTSSSATPSFGFMST